MALPGEFRAVRTADQVVKDLVDWKALVPSANVKAFLASAPTHTLPRICLLWQLPLDCMTLILGFVPIAELVQRVARACRSLAKLARSSPVWRQFDLAMLVERSGVRVHRSPPERSEFWMTQLVRGRFKNLKSIDAATAPIHHRDLRNALMGSPKLTSLDLSYCEGFDDQCCAVIGQAECCRIGTDVGVPGALQHLRLNFCLKFNAYTMTEAVARSGNLKTLELSGCTQISGDDFRRMLLNLPTLHTLRLRSTRASVESFRPAEGQSYLAPALSVLDLAGCHEINDEAVALMVRGMPSLTYLSLESCGKVTDAGVVALCRAGVPLSSLILSGCGGLTDTSLRLLSDTLTMSLTRVAIDRSKVTGATLCSLLSMPRLEWISCNACLYAARDCTLSADLRRVVTSKKHLVAKPSRDFLGIRDGVGQVDAKRKRLGSICL